MSTNIEDPKIVLGWIAGSGLEIVIRNLAEGEAELERAKKKVAAAKKALARVISM